MIDVLELAQQRRAVLLKEIETLNWFIATAMRLAEGPATNDLLLNRISLDMDATGMTERSESAETPFSNAVTVAAPAETRAELVTARQAAGDDAEPAATFAEKPLDSLIFKRMLSEMRRKHQDQMFTGHEKVAASG